LQPEWGFPDGIGDTVVIQEWKAAAYICLIDSNGITLLIYGLPRKPFDPFDEDLVTPKERCHALIPSECHQIIGAKVPIPVIDEIPPMITLKTKLLLIIDAYGVALGQAMTDHDDG
jgi:hypothetical protein